MHAWRLVRPRVPGTMEDIRRSSGKRPLSKPFCFLPIVAVAALLLVLTACGGSSKLSASSPTPAVGVPPSSVASGVAPAKTAAALPTVSATSSAPAPAALSVGMQGALGYDTVLYYSTGCFACGRPQVPNLFRRYLDQAGNEHTDDLFAPLASYGGYPHSFAADWSRGDLWVALCTHGYCGGETEPSGEPVERLMHSADGGVTWEDKGTMTVDTFLYGAFGKDVLEATLTDGRASYRFAESGQQLSAPRTDLRMTPQVVPGASADGSGEPGIVWQGIAADGTSNGRFYDLNGEPLVSGPSAHSALLAKTAQGFLMSWQDVAGGPQLVGYLDDSEHVLSSWKWSESHEGQTYLTVAGQLTSGLLYGTALLPDFFGFGTDGSERGDQAHGRMYPIEGVFLKLDSSTVHPIIGLSFGLTGNSSPFIVHMDQGPVRRVATGSDCLNVREATNLQAKTLGCFADGVLLRLTSDPQVEVEGITWVGVRTPDGQAGWVSGAYLETGSP